MGHQSSTASPYIDSMMQRTDTYDEDISFDNAKAWDAFTTAKNEWLKVYSMLPCTVNLTHLLHYSHNT
eukprot:scaffold824_cov132-Chaetoceros_neogracile.AAC.9